MKTKKTIMTAIQCIVKLISTKSGLRKSTTYPISAIREIVLWYMCTWPGGLRDFPDNREDDLKAIPWRTGARWN
jgi:hypothetical protein